MRIKFHPAAEAEIIEAARYYETREHGLGSVLLAEVERALNMLSVNPEASARIGNRVRSKSLLRFPFNLIYAIHADRMRVIALAHQKRRPLYWRDRLTNSSE